MRKQHWQDWINVLLGAWLFFSPWLLGYFNIYNAAWNAYVLGIAIFVFAVWALYAPEAWEEWTLLILGIWLVISPWVLGFYGNGNATWNMVIVGILTIIFASFTFPFWTQRVGIPGDPSNPGTPTGGATRPGGPPAGGGAARPGGSAPAGSGATQPGGASRPGRGSGGAAPS